MNKPNYLYGIIGLLVGLIIGYIGTDSINKTLSPAATGDSPASVNSLPPNHPPTGAQSNAGSSGSDQSPSDRGGPEQGGAGQGESGQGPQSDVMAIIQQAQKEPDNFQAQMKAADLFK